MQRLAIITSILLCTFVIQAREALEFKISAGKNLITDQQLTGDLRLRLTLDAYNGEMGLLAAIYDYTDKDHLNPDWGILNSHWQIGTSTEIVRHGNYFTQNEIILGTPTANGIRALIFSDYYDADDNFISMRVAIYDFNSGKELYTFAIPRQSAYPAFGGNLIGYVNELIHKAHDIGVVTLAPHD